MSKQPWLKRKGYWKVKCDTVFANIVKTRARGRCQETNGDNFPQCAHIISRSYHSAAWDLDNAICLTRNRHKYYTHHPLEWEVFVDRLLGLGYHNKMKQRALSYRTWTLADYKELHEKLETIRDSWDNERGEFRICANPGSAGLEHEKPAISGKERVGDRGV